jgi:hypothetical protein
VQAAVRVRVRLDVPRLRAGEVPRGAERAAQRALALHARRPVVRRGTGAGARGRAHERVRALDARRRQRRGVARLVIRSGLRLGEGWKRTLSCMSCTMLFSGPSSFGRRIGAFPEGVMGAPPGVSDAGESGTSIGANGSRASTPGVATGDPCRACVQPASAPKCTARTDRCAPCRGEPQRCP